MSSPAIAPPQVRWDLSVLYSSITDPKIDELWTWAVKESDAIAEIYRGKIDSPDLTAALLLEVIQRAEALTNEVVKPLSFASLLFSTDTSSAEIGGFMQKQRERATELSVKLLFLELELQALDQAVLDRVLADPILENYRHHILTTRTYSPFRLSEPEEIILEETANTGSRAWVRLFEQVVSNHTYQLELPGEEPATVTQQELLKHLRDPDREVRRIAAAAFTKGLQEIEKTVVFIYNTLMQDKAVEDRLRTMEYPEQGRHLSNELEKSTVDLVIDVCRENYGLVSRFYTVKRGILGLEELTHLDRYAPLFEAEREVSWDEAKQIVLTSFAGFSQEMADRAAEFFDQNWIDAEPRKGKRGGAFCSYLTPDTHPVVFQSYLNKSDDVMTLAHELGHGVHASFSREQSYFNFHGTLPLAELASTFGEMLVFENLVSEASTKDKLALYAEKIEGVFATIFRQAAMFRFEQRSHQARRTEGELAPEDFSAIWQEEMQAMFGDSVKLGDEHRHWWLYVSHFFASPFYVYAYSFGELLVLSLYQIAKEKGPAFADDYTKLLKLGGSKSPKELMALVGIDLDDREFWLGGFRALEGLVAEFERLWAEYNR